MIELLLLYGFDTLEYSWVEVLTVWKWILVLDSDCIERSVIHI
jgi:hypothetical protein